MHRLVRNADGNSGPPHGIEGCQIIRSQHLVPYTIYWWEERQWGHQNLKHVTSVQQENHTLKVPIYSDSIYKDLQNFS